MVIAKKFILEKPFSGAPTEDNFKLVEEELDELNKGGNIYILIYTNQNCIHILKC
jgi:hypothetical protein